MARESFAARAEAVQRVASATSGSDPIVQKAAFEALGRPTQGTTDWLWLMLVGGLVSVLIVAVVGLLVWAGRTGAQTDKLVTVISAVLAGLLGLFVTSPPQSGAHG